MRVVAGEFKGRVIDSPSAKTTRPTTDRVRESMFSAIYSRISDLEDVSVLDAFAGSGALGIEALSRGAASCVFFETDAAARRVLAGNIKRMELPSSRAIVYLQDAFGAAKRPVRASQPFGLVLLDPPYAQDAARVEGLLVDLVASKSLAAGAIVVYEHAHADSKAVEKRFDENTLFEVLAMKKYGKIGVAFLRYRA